ncbi:MAG TPA: PVC-type heme-binding CxxCH protein [Longimicrobiaceae bacterium]|nr:PVC-type heme-binding CxxCH protein [Longimicrobiaceae bacterium]
MALRIWPAALVVLAGCSLWMGPATGPPTGGLGGDGLPTFADREAARASLSDGDARRIDYARYSGLPSPPLSPAAALALFALEEGFRIEIVAYEPDVVDPIAMDIDRDGRLWVVEMSSYMPVHDRTEAETSLLERVPNGRIVVLEDTDADGRMDRRWVFMDQLVLPRAIKVMDYGVLVAEPPNVWFIRDADGDGIGDTRQLVYESYGDTTDYNVEHMPNGLMWGMDNWLHSANPGVESLRYRNGRWETRPFEALGQWGITQDDWGRLYAAHNSRTLTAHLAPYGYSGRHPRFRMAAGIYRTISESETMWPAHATGVNRGYLVDDIVRQDGTLRRSTATAGAVIYRGHQFGEEYRGNAFVPEPAGNLIKRLVGIDEAPGEIEAVARFAYQEREFLTSTDERFRPVNLYNAPDGSIYVVDMYRGIFQHARYLTGHLRDHAVEQGLHEPLGMGQFGRIYRIVRADRPIRYGSPRLSQASPDELAGYLGHENGAIRDAAQQLLVQRSPAAAVPILEGLVRDPAAEFYTRLQALWTLEGFEVARHPAARTAGLALAALDDPHPRVRAAALRILEPEIRDGAAAVIARLDRMATEETAPYTRLQLLASLGESPEPSALRTIARILHQDAGTAHFREMALTGVAGREAELIAILTDEHGWRAGGDEGRAAVLDRLRGALSAEAGAELRLAGEELRLFTLGARRFTACAVCHGGEGEGVEGVAPPLAGSAWVRSDPAAIVRIVLHGLSGAAVEAGRRSGGVMPSHQFMSDEDLAAILTYIRQSWMNGAAPIATASVAEIRQATAGRQGEWTPGELRELTR